MTTDPRPDPGHEPPRWAVRLLESVLPPTERSAAMVGDLHEEFVMRARRSPVRARLWYLREALGVGVRYARKGRRYLRRAPSLAGRAGGDRRSTTEVMVDGFGMNIRYAMRRLARSPMFTVVAVLSLGIGIGANTAMFSLVNAVIIRDMPFEDPDRLVDVYESEESFSHGTLSYPDYVDFEAGTADVFEAMGGMQVILAQADTDDGVEMLFGEAVTGNYFSILGIEAAQGRMISPEDHVARGAHPVVVLSWDHWVNRYGADPSIIGGEVRLSGRPYTVIGVAPEKLAGSLRGLEPSIYVSIAMTDAIQGSTGNTWEARGTQSFFGKARLRPGATFAQAEQAAERVAADLRSIHPDYWGPNRGFALVPTDDVIMNPMIDRFIVPAAGMIMGVVGLVLLIACANLASFLLARAADRRKEIAVRLAMGARRRTLVAQLLTETLIIAGLGGALGILIASQVLRMLLAADLPLPFPVTLDLSIDRTVLGFSILASLGAGILFGLAPALQSTNPDLAPTLRDETAGGGRAKGALLRNALVVGQVSVSVVLLVAAGLFLRSLDASRNVDPGFGGAPTGLVELTLPGDRYGEQEALVYLETLVERMEALPGVEAVGMIDNLHMNQLNTQTVRVTVDGIEPPPGREFFGVDYAITDDGFLEAIGTELVEGRGFTTEDRADGERVAIVNEEFARRFFPEGGSLGRTIVLNGDEHRVVGVTEDHKVRSLGEAPRPFVRVSHRQWPSNYMWFAARTGGDADRLVLDMMAEARALDPEIMIVAAKTLDRHLAIMLLGRELGALVVGGFALLALLLASIGLYGVVSYAVSRRAREVGIRLSLGADSRSVVRMLTGSGMRLVAIGGVVGLGVAAGLAQLLSRLLYGVPPLDAGTFIAVPVVLAAVAFLASWVPARRVTRIDPVGALRSE